MATRLWRSMFGAKDDLEKKLQLLTNEEKTVQSRIKRRARSSSLLVRHVIKTSMLLEILVVIYAILMTREPDLSWQIRSLRLLPVIAVPVLAATIYYILSNLRKICEKQDKNRLEWLREERQAKVNELKEKSNYYATQVLIQRYDLDPAEKAAAAKILATRLGSESGLKLSIGDDESNHNINSSFDENYNDDEIEENNHKADLEKFKVSGGNIGNGWFAEIAALLVGEHPSQCFALICNECYMHNGLARKEDLAFIRYYCPHCHALNESKQKEAVGVHVGSEMEAPVSKGTGEAIAGSSLTAEQVNDRRTGEEEGT